MGATINNEYENNLLVLRKELGFTQLEIASIIGISERTYRKYEQWTKELPAHIAKKIADKYGYSLDWIYCLSEKPKRTDQFMVDIRDVVKYKNNRIFIEIDSSYMEYLSKRETIQNKNDTLQNKDNEIAALDSKFIFENMNFFDKLVIDVSKEKFVSVYKNGKEEISVCLGENKINNDEISDEQVSEVQNFLNSFSSVDTNENK